MRDDIYYDCPECAHTMLLSHDQVGGTVECPECRNEILVPDIREGVNPRFRGGKATGVPPARVEGGRMRTCRERLDGLEETLRSLSKRNSLRIEQMGLMEKSAELVHRQVELLDGSRGKGLAAAEGTLGRASESGDASFWGAVTIGLGLATLAVAAVLAFVRF